MKSRVVNLVMNTAGIAGVAAAGTEVMEVTAAITTADAGVTADVAVAGALGKDGSAASCSGFC